MAPRSPTSMSKVAKIRTNCVTTFPFTSVKAASIHKFLLRVFLLFDPLVFEYPSHYLWDDHAGYTYSLYYSYPFLSGKVRVGNIEAQIAIGGAVHVKNHAQKISGQG